MYLIDPTNNQYFQSLAKYTKEKIYSESLITDDYSKEGLWILNFVSFKNGVHKKIKGDYIVIQSEQLNVRGDAEYTAFLKGAMQVWDMSKDYKIGYSNAWRIEMEEAKDIDVLFYGCMNDRRRNIIESIQRSVTVLENVYGAELQKYVMRSKVVLSIHYYENAMNDMARIAPLLSNHAFVIAEKCSEEWFNKINEIVIVDKDKISSAINTFLIDVEARLKMIDAGYYFIRGFNGYEKQIQATNLSDFTKQGFWDYYKSSDK